MDEQNYNYAIGDMFVDSFSSYDVASYIFRIQYQPDSRITYYWLRYFNDTIRDTYWTKEELDDILQNSKENVKYYPVIE